MVTKCTRISFDRTGYFSKLVTDYINAAATIRPFFQHPVNLDGIKAAIENRKQNDVNRPVLVEELKQQYALLQNKEKVSANIEALLDANTFVITTAHQPNIFTGPLYFLYKILHAVKLSAYLREQLPQYNFVPVYYMGSEDADLDEVGSFSADGVQYKWDTKQTGAVGRMKVDDAFLKMMSGLKGQAGVLPHGNEIMEMFASTYTKGKSIQQATLELVHTLFGEYGVVVLIPDNVALKRLFIPVVEKELTEQFSEKHVETTIAELGKHYKVQVAGRNINMFYLEGDIRDRIEFKDGFYTTTSNIFQFNKEQILQELYAHPERFSANVILRGVFQEKILPGIVYIGGGGELAYWLELKEVFNAAETPYPLLLLRNSYLFAGSEISEKINRAGFAMEDIFLPENELMNRVVERQSTNQYSLENEIKQANEFYKHLSELAAKTDITLAKHVLALQTKAIYRIEQLQKKMLRAEKRKFETERRHVQYFKQRLFPGGGLQERSENISILYGKYGHAFIDSILENASALEQEFAIVEIKQ